jgi:hypothetical protein
MVTNSSRDNSTKSYFARFVANSCSRDLDTSARIVGILVTRSVIPRWLRSVYPSRTLKRFVSLSFPFIIIITHQFLAPYRKRMRIRSTIAFLTDSRLSPTCVQTGVAIAVTCYLSAARTPKNAQVYLFYLPPLPTSLIFSVQRMRHHLSRIVYPSSPRFLRNVNGNRQPAPLPNSRHQIASTPTSQTPPSHSHSARGPTPASSRETITTFTRHVSIGYRRWSSSWTSTVWQRGKCSTSTTSWCYATLFNT